jgi:hypothetical protein
MKRLTRIVPILVLALAVCLGAGCSSDNSKDKASKESQQRQKRYLAFGGGPTGGTFNFFANKISSIISGDYTWIDVAPRGSGGSAENLRSLNKNGVDLGIVYSGDAFLGRNANLPDDPVHYDRVRALSFLYGAPAQLVVRRDSGIESVRDLEGKVVAVGNPGSGAALSAERFFRHLSLWDKMKIRNLGYSQAASDFADKRIDAFWVLVGYPNSAIIEAATRVDIRLLNLHRAALDAGFYGVYPFYARVEIPAGTYPGQDEAVATFQDSSLWCASDVLGENVVYECLKAIYSSEGLEAMGAAHKAARGMSLSKGLDGVSIPLHPGAVRFWKEQGETIPAHLLP